MVTFREFKVGDLFDGASGDTDIKKEHLNDEGYPVITAGVDNLGVAGYSSINAKILPENSLTVDMFGNCYFRPFEFKMVTHSRVFALTLKNRPLTQEAGLFICTMLKWLQSKYNYSNMCTYNKIKNEIIQLPVKPGTDEINYTEDDIDWDYMESYIHDLEQSYIHNLEQSYIHDLDAYLQETGLNDYTLTDDEQELLEREPMFREFKVGDLFDVTQGRRLKKSDFDDGDIPFVMASSQNNGVVAYISNPVTTNENFITADILGNVFYQDGFTGFGDDNCGLKLKNGKESEAIYLYLVNVLSCFKTIASYGNKLRGKWYKEQFIQLPVKPNTDESSYTEDDIDWDYMESYIRAMEKQVITDVVDYKDSMITTAKELVYV